MSLKKILSERIWQSHQYEALSDLPDSEHTHADRVPDASKEADSLQTRTRTLHSSKYRQFLLSAVITLILLVTTTTIYFLLSSFLHSTTYDQCGTTPKEALSRGCVFETTLSLWVPPSCYDRELELEYLSDPTLAYYRDLNLTDRVPLEEVQLGEVYAWFVPWEHHIRHCAFSLRKFHRAVERGGPVDGYVLSYSHTMHCIMMMTEPEEDRVKLVQRDVRMYPYCGRRGGYNVDKLRRFQWTD